MKLLSDIAKNSLPSKSQGKIVHMTAVLGGWRTLDNPILSTEMECLICSCKEHYTPLIKPGVDDKRVWICANGNCASNKLKKDEVGGYTPVTQRRAILWQAFCEITGIGDAYHDVKFEDVQQSEGKISYMLKFAASPRGIALMRGNPGTGKTYSAMAICELFTRRDTSAIFTTQKQMSNDWQDMFKNQKDTFSNYVQKLSTKTLLVIDDFGTGDVTPGFMSFFMDLINTRMQWKSRGTVITTNLDDEQFSKICGQALADRIATGQILEFKGPSRRDKTIL